VQEPVDSYIYAKRNRIERGLNKLKNSRRLATRYDKTAESYLGFVQIAAIRLWTRMFVNRT
jgi:transposase